MQDDCQCALSAHPAPTQTTWRTKSAGQEAHNLTEYETSVGYIGRYSIPVTGSSILEACSEIWE